MGLVTLGCVRRKRGEEIGKVRRNRNGFRLAKAKLGGKRKRKEGKKTGTFKKGV